jgi:hypothetical protein
MFVPFLVAIVSAVEASGLWKNAHLKDEFALSLSDPFTTIIIVGPFLHNAPITLIRRICSSSPLSQSVFLTPCLDPRHNVPKGFLLHFLRLTPLADTPWKRKDHGRKWSRRQLQKRLCLFCIKYGDMIMNPTVLSQKFQRDSLNLTWTNYSFPVFSVSLLLFNHLYPFI